MEQRQLSPDRPRLLASWQRSERYGVSLDEVKPVFTGSADTGSLLYECGYEVLSGLQVTEAHRARGRAGGRGGR